MSDVTTDDSSAIGTVFWAVRSMRDGVCSYYFDNDEGWEWVALAKDATRFTQEQAERRASMLDSRYPHQGYDAVRVTVPFTEPDRVSALASSLAEAERRVKELEGALNTARVELGCLFATEELAKPCVGLHDVLTVLNAADKECIASAFNVIRAALSPRHQSAEGAEGEGT